jgi:hypothetical protein
MRLGFSYSFSFATLIMISFFPFMKSTMQARYIRSQLSRFTTSGFTGHSDDILRSRTDQKYDEHVGLTSYCDEVGSHLALSHSAWKATCHLLTYSRCFQRAASPSEPHRRRRKGFIASCSSTCAVRHP